MRDHEDAVAAAARMAMIITVLGSYDGRRYHNLPMQTITVQNNYFHNNYYYSPSDTAFRRSVVHTSSCFQFFTRDLLLDGFVGRLSDEGTGAMMQIAKSMPFGGEYG
ncbi:hypothetical protein LEN26_021018 [Aphanomyces euteiches]|nr:hypothetical protein LEN26_021018 [Aphanomyces euteiches]KAH9117079.1 hypothetical protein AeMF1_009046 [Aphanomyces euteiches]